MWYKDSDLRNTMCVYWDDPETQNNLDFGVQPLYHYLNLTQVAQGQASYKGPNTKCDGPSFLN